MPSDVYCLAVFVLTRKIGFYRFFRERIDNEEAKHIEPDHGELLLS